MWLVECPSFWDQGLIRPLVTEDGELVLMCDSCTAVWRTPAGIEEFDHVEPAAPDWSIGPDTHVRPGTTRWADPADVTAAGWGELRWRELPYAADPGPPPPALTGSARDGQPSAHSRA
ncbi:hypothetical protein GCM10022222_66110 [Amycolatopsis ultiminotia]|uniref:Uncharacterized protein n=1 Tax=Amycolatopsis ultiminotia TaxID=543629 RepID=A0ABP6XUA8_9PSEU